MFHEVSRRRRIFSNRETVENSEARTSIAHGFDWPVPEGRSAATLNRSGPAELYARNISQIKCSRVSNSAFLRVLSSLERKLTSIFIICYQKPVSGDTTRTAACLRRRAFRDFEILSALLVYSETTFAGENGPNCHKAASSQTSSHELLICSGWVRQRLANVKLSHSPRRYARAVDCRDRTFAGENGPHCREASYSQASPLELLIGDG
jgi:hypothetical protein